MMNATQFIFTFLLSILFLFHADAQNAPWELVPTPAIPLQGLYKVCDGILATTSQGIYYSADYGDTWQMAEGSPDTGLGVIAAANSAVLLKSSMMTSQTPSCQYFNEYYYSYNCSNNSVSPIMTFSGQSCWHSCSNPSYGVAWGEDNFAIKRATWCIYAGMVSCEVWTSTNGGLSWSEADSCSSFPAQIDTGYIVKNDSLFMVLPGYPGNHEFLNPSPFANSTGHTEINDKLYFSTTGSPALLYKTDDLGETWFVDTLATGYVNHMFSKEGVLFVETYKGLFKSSEPFLSGFETIWDNTGSGISLSHYLIDENVWLLALENGQMLRSFDHGNTWDSPLLNDLPRISVTSAHYNGDLVFFRGYNDIWYHGTDTAGFYWMPLGFPADTAAYYFENQQRQFLFTSKPNHALHLFQSSDTGNNWDTIGYITHGLPLKHIIEGDSIYVLTPSSNGAPKVYYSNDNGDNWQFSPSVQTTEFAARSGNWYRSYNGNIELSENNGLSWTTELESCPAIDQVGDTIYALKKNNLNFQIYFLSDSTSQWQPIGDMFEWEVDGYKYYAKDGHFIIQGFNHDKILITDYTGGNWKEFPMFADYIFWLSLNPPAYQTNLGALSYFIAEGDLYMMTQNDGLWKMKLCGLSAPHSDLFASTCPNAPYFFNGNEYTQEGIYEVYFPINPSCDSIVYLHLEYSTDTTILEQTICEGESYIWGSASLSNPGTYIKTFTSSQGCDSTVILKLEVLNENIHFDWVETLCQNESIILHGIIYDIGHPSGTDTLFNAAYNGCDSLIHVQINFLPIFENTDTIALESGMEFHGTPIFSDTTFIENYMAENGCDSTVTTHVSILTGTDDILKKTFDLNIYPNPVGDEFYIDFYLPENMEMEIKVVDILGKEVDVFPGKTFFQKGKHSLPIKTKGWEGGIYFAQVQSGGKGICKRIFKL